MSQQTFAGLGLSAPVVRALAQRGIITPFPIQSLVMPDVLAGRDVLAPGIIAFSGIASVLFLGGFRPLPGLAFIPGPIWMLAKIGLLAFLVIWLRVTYPRLREDQLQRISWVVLIPIALADILVTAVIKVAVK